MYGALEPAPKRNTLYGGKGAGAKLTPPESPAMFQNSRSSTSLTGDPCPWPLHNVVPQPPADYEPFGFPLMHTICLVTAYSESVEGLRTTLDSLATTDYPNSHKLILIIADGLVKGAGNDLTTPDICLGMMKDLVVPAEEVEPHSYVAIADGHKRHNMAKVYAGFYEYDDATVERSKQQRVPVVLVAKVGNPLEASDAKPGNRGKRDSQIVLMAFLQKVMFDERMTTFEYEFFNSVWRCAGISPDRYELVLCVDADTKVFPDSLSRMAACMAQDEEIMGLCGETKIANKAETWVTMIQGRIILFDRKEDGR
jgi:chitin synthase